MVCEKVGTYSRNLARLWYQYRYYFRVLYRDGRGTQETITLMRNAQFDFAYMYFYSERQSRLAARRIKDDIPELVKKRRLQEIIDMQSEVSKRKMKLELETHIRC